TGPVASAGSAAATSPTTLWIAPWRRSPGHRGGSRDNDQHELASDREGVVAGGRVRLRGHVHVHVDDGLLPDAVGEGAQPPAARARRTGEVSRGGQPVEPARDRVARI